VAARAARQIEKGDSMQRYVAITLAAALLLWAAVSLSGLDRQWLGVAIDGGLLKPHR